MADIIIVGLAPGSSRFNEDTSPTRKRVRKWLGAAKYDWTRVSTTYDKIFSEEI